MPACWPRVWLGCISKVNAHVGRNAPPCPADTDNYTIVYDPNTTAATEEVFNFASASEASASRALPHRLSATSCLFAWDTLRAHCRVSFALALWHWAAASGPAGSRFGHT